MPVVFRGYGHLASVVAEPGFEPGTSRGMSPARYRCATPLGVGVCGPTVQACAAAHGW